MKNILLPLLFLALASCNKQEVDTPGLLVPKTVNEDYTLPSLPINGTILHVEAFGNPMDPIVIMIHGGPGGDYRSLLNAQQLVEDHFFVVFYDQRGTGLSKREDKAQYENSHAMNLFMGDLDALIHHFQLSETQKVFLFGHSWGAMLASGYVNLHPENISGLILAEPGGLTWTQTQEYLDRSNHIEFFSEALNNAIFPEQIFAGRSEHEVLDYKASFFSTFENAPGNTIGNPGPYPFWRNGAVSFDGLIHFADEYGFDFTSHLGAYETPILFLYSANNTAYGADWAHSVSAPFPQVELKSIPATGHEMLFFGWQGMYPSVQNYLNQMR